MPTATSGYSRFVRILKISLPLIALGLLASLFLFSERIQTGRAIPVAGVDVDQIIRDQGIGAPSFVGATSGGATLRLTADRVIPEAGADSGMSARDVRASIELPAGSQFTFTANNLRFYAESSSALFSGNVLVDANPQLSIKTESLLATDNFSTLIAPGQVAAEGAFGQIQAGSMELTLSDKNDADSAFRLVFQDGIRLTIDPNR